MNIPNVGPALKRFISYFGHPFWNEHITHTATWESIDFSYTLRNNDRTLYLVGPGII